MRATGQQPDKIMKKNLVKALDALDALRSNGFVVIDNALPPDLCAKLRSEMKLLWDKDQLWERGGFLGQKGTPEVATKETPKSKFCRHTMFL